MGVSTPAPALADQLELGLALARHQLLEWPRQRDDGGAGDGRQCRTCIPEDAGVSVLVGGDRAGDAHLCEHTGEDPQRVLLAGVLGVGRNARDGGFRLDACDLELGHEHRGLAAGAFEVGDRALRRQEREPRQVLDVALVEDHESGRVAVGDKRPQPRTSLTELVGGDAGCDDDGRDDIRLGTAQRTSTSTTSPSTRTWPLPTR